jgi:hypothetical protein
MHGGRILDVLRANKVMNDWLVVVTVSLGLGSLILHRHDVQRALIRIAFGWFVLGAPLLGYGRERL